MTARQEIEAITRQTEQIRSIREELVEELTVDHCSHCGFLPTEHDDEDCEYQAWGDVEPRDAADEAEAFFERQHGWGR